MKSPTRKDSPAIKVYCMPDERAQLQANAVAARHSVSSYLLNVALGYRIRSMQDHQYVEQFIRVHGDLGRLCGLFKLWLTNGERTAEVGEPTIRAVLEKIEATRDELRDVIRALVTPGTGPDEL